MELVSALVFECGTILQAMTSPTTAESTSRLAIAEQSGAIRWIRIVPRQNTVTYAAVRHEGTVCFGFANYKRREEAHHLSLHLWLCCKMKGRDAGSAHWARWIRVSRADTRQCHSCNYVSVLRKLMPRHRRGGEGLTQCTGCVRLGIEQSVEAGRAQDQPVDRIVVASLNHLE